MCGAAPKSDLSRQNHLKVKTVVSSVSAPPTWRGGALPSESLDKSMSNKHGETVHLVFTPWKISYSLEQLKVHGKSEGRVQRLPIYPVPPTHTNPHPPSVSPPSAPPRQQPHQVVHLLPLMHLHWHVVITQSPQLASRSFLVSYIL